MNGHLPHANKQALHHVDADGKIVRDELPDHEFDFCQNDGKCNKQYVYNDFNLH